MILIANIIGIIGVGIILTTYYLMQTRQMSSQSKLYCALNIIGSALILYSLFFEWNLSAAIIEIAWIVISAIGLYKITSTPSTKVVYNPRKPLD